MVSFLHSYEFLTHVVLFEILTEICTAIRKCLHIFPLVPSRIGLMFVKVYRNRLLFLNRSVLLLAKAE